MSKGPNWSAGTALTVILELILILILDSSPCTVHTAQRLACAMKMADQMNKGPCKPESSTLTAMTRRAWMTMSHGGESDRGFRRKVLM